MAEKTYCKSCGCARTLHSRQGCVNRFCDLGAGTCKVKYMDKDMFESR